jgi:hypothetical protein
MRIFFVVQVSTDFTVQLTAIEHPFDNTSNKARTVQASPFIHASKSVCDGTFIQYSIFIFILNALLQAIRLLAKQHLPHLVVNEMEHAY